MDRGLGCGLGGWLGGWLGGGVGKQSVADGYFLRDCVDEDGWDFAFLDILANRIRQLVDLIIKKVKMYVITECMLPYFEDHHPDPQSQHPIPSQPTTNTIRMERLVPVQIALRPHSG